MTNVACSVHASDDVVYPECVNCLKVRLQAQTDAFTAAQLSNTRLCETLYVIEEIAYGNLGVNGDRLRAIISLAYDARRVNEMQKEACKTDVLVQLTRRIEALERQQEITHLSLSPCRCVVAWSSIPGDACNVEATHTVCARCLRLRELQVTQETGGT